MKRYLICSLLLGALLACSRGSKKEAPMPINTPPTVVEHINSPAGAESFDSFNARFHSDSVFQVSRIAFPIGGQFVDDMNNGKWSSQNWEFLTTPVSVTADTSECRHSLTMSDSMVTEKFWIDQSGFKVERRFRLIGGRWYLVYYDDINM